MAKQNKNATGNRLPATSKNTESSIGKNDAELESESSPESAPEEVKASYSREEKVALIDSYKGVQEKMKLLNTQMDELRAQKSDVAFELQKAFGDKKFKLDGVICRVVKHTGRGTKETVWYVKSIDTNVDEEF